jgi:hypothetical protein
MDIYVDKNAPAGGNGSAASPIQTVTQAKSAAGPGTTIHIAPETYDEANPMLFSEQVNIVKWVTGAGGNPVIK